MVFSCSPLCLCSPFAGLGWLRWHSAVFAVALLLVGDGLASEFRPRNVAVVVVDGVAFGLRDQVFSKLKKGTRLTVTETRGAWVGGFLQRGDEDQLGWVKRGFLKLVFTGPPPLGLNAAHAVSELVSSNVRVDVSGEGYVHTVRAIESFPSSALASLKSFERLVVLDLGGSGVGDADLAAVRDLNSLEQLYLDRTQVTDEGLRQLSQLKKLEVLILAGTRVTGRGLKHLHQLRGLRTLNLSDCRIQDEDLLHLSGFSNIEVLTLCNTPITGTGLMYVKSLLNLRVLNLSASGVQDPGMKHLEGMPSLKMIYLKGTAVTEKATDELDKTLTSCSIYHD